MNTVESSSIHGLSVVIPLYNEEDSVAKTIERLEALSEKIRCPHEFILINDGSTDQTPLLLMEQITNHGTFHQLNHTTNRGYGAALKTGIRRARYAWIAITDADGTYPLDRIPDLYTHALENEFEMVVGARTGNNVKQPLLRRPPKWILRMLASSLSGTHIPDLNSGLRVFRKSIAIKYLGILPDGFSFTTTITLALLSKSHPIDFLPIDLFHRTGKSKIRPIYDTLNFLQQICRTVLWLNPLRVFIPLSGIFVLAGIATLLLSWKLLGSPLDMTSALLIQTGVILLAVGMLADLIDKRSD